MNHFLMFVIIVSIIVIGCNPNPPSTRKKPEPKPKPQSPKQSWREEAKMHWRDFVTIFGGRK